MQVAMPVVAMFFVVTVVLFALAVTGFNRIQRARQAVAEAWAQVDTQLQRRYDLVRALNQVVAEVSRHERETLVTVTGERAGTARDRAERSVQDTAGRLLATAEALPTLRTDDNFRRLQDELVRTEDDVAASRRYYNGRVRLLNTTRQTFPWLLVARLLRVEDAAYFQIDLDEGQAPGVR